MPYKKPERVPFQALAELLRGKGINSPQLAKILGCSQNTALKRLKQPELFTMKDLIKLHSKGHLTLDEIREGIRE